MGVNDAMDPGTASRFQIIHAEASAPNDLALLEDRWSRVSSRTHSVRESLCSDLTGSHIGRGGRLRLSGHSTIYNSSCSSVQQSLVASETEAPARRAPQQSSLSCIGEEGKASPPSPPSQLQRSVGKSSRRGEEGQLQPPAQALKPQRPAGKPNSPRLSECCHRRQKHPQVFPATIGSASSWKGSTGAAGHAEGQPHHPVGVADRQANDTSGPQERFPFPVTSAQDVGWRADHAGDLRKWEHKRCYPKAQKDITQAALTQREFALTHPFDLPSGESPFGKEAFLTGIRRDRINEKIVR